MIFSNILDSNAAPVANSRFLPTQTENTSLTLPLIHRPVSYTSKSLGIESIVKASNLGLNDATMIESAKYDPACPVPPYPTIITLILPYSSPVIDWPKLLEMTLTVPLVI